MDNATTLTNDLPTEGRHLPDHDLLATLLEGGPAPDAYHARLERQRKLAAVRTELVHRNHRPQASRPDGTF